mgnify:CR=1 FL=1
MASLLTLTEYPAVRAAIDISLTATDLPDEVIGLPIYASAAEAAVKARDPDWDTRTGAAKDRLVEAVICWTASLLAPALPALKSEAHPEGYSYSREIDYVGRASALRQQAETALTAVLTPSDPAAGRPTFFALATGRRGR